MSVALNVGTADTPLVLGVTHGHMARSADQMERFWSGQASARQPVGAADLLISGHWHHLRVQQPPQVTRERVRQALAHAEPVQEPLEEPSDRRRGRPARTVKMGGDVGTAPRRHAPVPTEPQPQLNPWQRGMIRQLGVEQGLFGPENTRAKAARDQAAEVAERNKNHAYDTLEDQASPRRITDTRISGHTTGNG